MKISYSAWKKYLTCPKMYDLHYNEKLRPIGRSSALVFGSAIDSALNHLLLTGDDPLPVFQREFEFAQLQDVFWDEKDLDQDLFTEDQLDKLAASSHEYKCWASMRVKGRLLLETYRQTIYPLIEEVIHVQKTLDDRSGFLDAVVRLKAHGLVLMDHKTSAKPYLRSAIDGDPQLSLYAASEKIDKVAFCVLVKSIQKNRVKICKKCKFNGSYSQHKTCPKIHNGTRCHGCWSESVKPEAIVQLMVADVDRIAQVLVGDSIRDVEACVEKGLYPRNLQACGKIYGKPCPYINYCWKNDKSGLEYTKKEEKYDDQKK